MLDSEEKNRRTPVPPLKPVGQALVVPVEADSIDGPIVSYGDGPTSINFFTSDGQWGRHYGTNYEFCGDVDEMLQDYSHYVFSFHDAWKQQNK